MEILFNSVNEHSYECTLTVDCAVFGFQDNTLKVMLVKRAIEPYKDYWMLPGGVMDEGETLEESVDKVLFNLTGIRDIHKEQVKTYSKIDRHPVKRVVTICFYALVKPENHPVIPKNYVKDIKWFDVNDLPEMGFEHLPLAQDALIKLRTNLEQKLIFGELLPEKFTLTELQELYQSILGQQLDKRNFRKRILQTGLLEATNEKKTGVQGGPSLYKMKNLQS
ncbi:MAG: NUDIX domain-containing protein [Cyclobacteriaceae bacterium]